MLTLLVVAVFGAASLVQPSDPVLIRVPESGTDSVLGWSRIERSEVPDGIEIVEDAVLFLEAEPTDEPLFAGQWAPPMIGSPWAWQHSRGAEVVIAVVDSGVDLTHPDLSGRIAVNSSEVPGNGIDDDENGLIDDVTGWDFVGDDNDPTDDLLGHGTEVATIAAAAVNEFGITGIAPDATILPVRSCSSQCSLFDVAAGVEYAVGRGADIINLSLGGFANPGPLADAIDLAEANGVVVVAAAGNGGAVIDGTSYVPAALPNANLVAVAATTRDSTLRSDSNRGRSAVDLGAPGEVILAGTLNGTHHEVSGTSFAAPHLSGVLALMMPLAPTQDPRALIDMAGSFGTPRADLTDTTAFGTELAADRSVSVARWHDIAASPFTRDVVWADVAGIVRGCNPPTNDNYCPDRPLTRGEAATLLTRALNIEPTTNFPFTDTTDNPHHHAIAALANANITFGCNPPTNDNYCPDRPLTRGEAVALLRRALA